LNYGTRFSGCKIISFFGDYKTDGILIITFKVYETSVIPLEGGTGLPDC
jgi:hypothetical protein